MRILFMLSLIIFGCDFNSKPSFEYINPFDKGDMVILNKSTGVLVFINKSNRIVDVVKSDLSDNEMQQIQDIKQKRDGAIKLRGWGTQGLLGTKYTVSLATRYYKDRCLYILNFNPYDQVANYKAATVFVQLNDTVGFTLEKIIPESWSKVVDSTGTPISLQASGEFPITLDNYLEIKGYSPAWR